MITTAAASTLALLVLYGAALVVLLQTISDRYNAAILAPLLRRGALPWVTAQAAIALGAFALLGVPIPSTAKAILAGVLLTAGVILATVGCYRTWLLAGDRDQVAKSVGDLAAARRLGASREIVWNAIRRSDVEMVRVALRMFQRETPEQLELLTWLLGHRPLVNREWLSLELLGAIVGEGLDEPQAKTARDPLIALLRQNLDQEDMPVAYEIMHRTMRALAEGEKFTDAHGQLLLDVARGIWLVGDHMGEAPRTTHIPSQLEYLKSIYSSRRRDVFHALIKRKDRAGLSSFVTFVCLSLEDTNETGSAYSLLWDIADDGHEVGILEPQAIMEVGNAIGHLRMRELRNGETTEILAESWDDLAVQLVRDLIDLDVSDDDIHHMLGNYGYFVRPGNLAVKTNSGGRSDASERRLRRVLQKH